MNKDNKKEKELEIKVTDDRASTGTTDEDIKIKSIKASERTRSHLNSPGAKQRTFGSVEEMVKSAEETFNRDNSVEVALDAENGFDINDPKSVIAFDCGYTPLGYTVLVKIIKEEAKSATGLVLLPDHSTIGYKAVVVETGLLVNNLEKGDIVVFKPMKDNQGRIVRDLPGFIDMTLKKIKFQEVPYEALAGIYMSKKVLLSRIAEYNKLIGDKG